MSVVVGIDFVTGCIGSTHHISWHSFRVQLTLTFYL
jgi:hypothetical protein